jgi:hypothetical protein
MMIFAGKGPANLDLTAPTPFWEPSSDAPGGGQWLRTISLLWTVRSAA